MEKEWLDMLGQTIPKEMLLDYLDNHPELEDFTIQLSFKDLNPQSWRACWLIQVSSRKNDPKILPYLDHMILAIEGKSDGHQRELLKVILKMKWNEDQEGLLFEKCLDICSSISKSPSVRVTAFKVLSNLISKYPDLWHEIQFIVSEDYLDSLSQGIKNSFLRELDALRKKVLPRL